MVVAENRIADGQLRPPCVKHSFGYKRLVGKYLILFLIGHRRSENISEYSDIIVSD